MKLNPVILKIMKVTIQQMHIYTLPSFTYQMWSESDEQFQRYCLYNRYETLHTYCKPNVKLDCPLMSDYLGIILSYALNSCKSNFVNVMLNRTQKTINIFLSIYWVFFFLNYSFKFQITQIVLSRGNSGCE